jgi:hypothetical protein
LVEVEEKRKKKGKNIVSKEHTKSISNLFIFFCPFSFSLSRFTSLFSTALHQGTLFRVTPTHTTALSTFTLIPPPPPPPHPTAKQPTMASDICFLHFRIHDTTLASTSTATTSSSSFSINSNNNNNENNNNSTASLQSSAVTKAGGLQEWLCQLSILDDKTTVRGLLGPLVNPELKKAPALAACCTLQVATVPRMTPPSGANTQVQSRPSSNKARVLYAKTIQSEDLFRQGVECMCQDDSMEDNI